MNTTSFVIYCIIATFTPGPTNIVILSTVHQHGAKKAMNYTYTYGHIPLPILLKRQNRTGEMYNREK